MPRTLSRWDMAPSNHSRDKAMNIDAASHSPDVTMNMAVARPGRRTEAAIVQVRITCSHCSAPLSCSTKARGCMVRCPTCRKLFARQGLVDDADVAVQMITGTPSKLQNSGFSPKASDDGPAQRTEPRGVENQVKGFDADGGAASVIRSPSAGEPRGSNPDEPVPTSNLGGTDLSCSGKACH